MINKFIKFILKYLIIFSVLSFLISIFNIEILTKIIIGITSLFFALLSLKIIFKISLLFLGLLSINYIVLQTININLIILLYEYIKIADERQLHNLFIGAIVLMIAIVIYYLINTVSGKYDGEDYNYDNDY